ncbi:hypothetical protein OG322_10845 [Streptomyces sp. NBC_01260]|uniref:hypothetical protein n=1 Tax=Streptomyces sp. NBC_01260 TaxID=2903801 RepID=UPI002E30DCF8|nr:hypothetical protein [Streptomyces sp. NBC_01260]
MTDQRPLHDYGRSRAVLIGTWDYTHLTSVAAARHSLNRMYRLLTGPRCGWPEDRVAVLPNEPGPGDLSDRLLDLFEDTTDVALFYYVGHGQIDDEDQLCLGLIGSRTEPHRRATTSLPFTAVRRAAWATAAPPPRWSCSTAASPGWPPTATTPSPVPPKRCWSGPPGPAPTP